jgi:hypothetical protein
MANEIIINTHEGELNRDDECIHYPTYEITEDEGGEEKWYEVDAHVLQESTSSILRVVKEFESKSTAKEFALKFIKQNPLSELVIREKYEKDIFFYV